MREEVELPLPGWHRIGWLTAGLVGVLLGSLASAQQQSHRSEVPLDGMTEESLQEIARQVNNPVASLWQLTFDNQIVGLDGGDLEGLEPSYSGSFEPVLSVDLSRLGLVGFDWAADFRLVTQLTVPIIETVPEPSDGAGKTRKSGFGDIELAGVVSPNRLEGLVWGVGPTFIFPSASDNALGQGKWQAGPAAVTGYVGEKWTGYAVAQQWWSFAGEDDRPDTSQLCLEYALIRNLAQRWQLGFQPTMTVDWKAPRGNKVSFPVGLGVGKIVRIGELPVQIWLEADFYPVRPNDLSGPRWGIQLEISPVIPKFF